MMREVLRAMGIGCILAGGILYFTNDREEVVSPDLQQLQDEVIELQSELAKTKEELAIAQTSSSTEKDVPEEEVREKTEEDSNEPNLIIERGANSTFVATSLESLGIIQNAVAFDDYLTANGLSGKIQIGEYYLDSSMDFQTIAKKITTVK